MNFMNQLKEFCAKYGDHLKTINQSYLIQQKTCLHAHLFWATWNAYFASYCLEYGKKNLLLKWNVFKPGFCQLRSRQHRQCPRF